MLNEFRQDLVSGEWVLFSTERSKRPNGDSKNKERFMQAKENCPFEDPIAGSEGGPVLIYNKGHKVFKDQFDGYWTTVVINNKYPALRRGICGPTSQYGPFKVAQGNGFHELVITKDHDRSFAHFSTEETSEVMSVYLDRFNQISKDSCGDYVEVFHNHGISAGASISHNHSQILSTPILPPDIMGSIRGSMNYFNKFNGRVHKVLIDWEIHEGKRIIFENKKFICFCPYVSKTPYEIRIFPKDPNPRFNSILPEDVPLLAEALNASLKKLYIALDDPDYNFYIHTSPISEDLLLNYDFYHWHIEILPRISRIGGFEIGTNIYINSVDPDEAAKLLKDTKI